MSSYMARKAGRSSVTRRSSTPTHRSRSSKSASLRLFFQLIATLGGRVSNSLFENSLMYSESMIWPNGVKSSIQPMNSAISLLYAKENSLRFRWIVRRATGSRSVTLIDDLGAESSPEVKLYEFENPDSPITLDSAERSFSVPEAGGMYLAKSGNHSRAVILPPITVFHTLAALRINPRISHADYSTNGMLGLFSHVWTWYGAKLTGDPIAGARRRDAIRALLEHAFGVLGGGNWHRAEARVGEYRDLDALEFLKSNLSGFNEKSFGAALLSDRDQLAAADLPERIERFTDISTRYLDWTFTRNTSNSLTQRWISEFCLRLATGTDTTPTWAAQHVMDALSIILTRPALSRAARFLVLLVDKCLPSTPIAGGPVYNGWDWQ